MAQLEPDLPSGCADALAEVKEKVREAQHRAHRIVNATMIELYWNICRPRSAKSVPSAALPEV